jgi:hypothetical protein
MNLCTANSLGKIKLTPLDTVLDSAGGGFVLLEQYCAYTQNLGLAYPPGRRLKFTVSLLIGLGAILRMSRDALCVMHYSTKVSQPNHLVLRAHKQPEM